MSCFDGHFCCSFPKEQRRKFSSLAIIMSSANITISGKITLPESAPEMFPNGSHLQLKFEDCALQDVCSKLIGKTEVDLSTYKKGQLIAYSITCPRPEHNHDFYQVSAVLNVGWTPSKDEWVRRGDFLTDTMFNVSITPDVVNYTKDFYLIHYN